MFAKAALALVALVTPTFGIDNNSMADPSKYYADLGPYGVFTLEVSADDGTMIWYSDLKNLDKVAEEVGIDLPPTLNYHLHASWDLDVDYAIGREACGLANLGNHYDPFFACGPASQVPAENCTAIGRERSPERYSCSGSYALKQYDMCEVGDLSGKEGPLVVSADGTASGGIEYPDPLAVQDTHFVAERGLNPHNRFSSILYHDGSPRLLCAKLFEGVPPPKPEKITYEGYVEVKNLAPTNGTCQTPVWVGIHDGTFDTYDRNVALTGPFAFMEPLVEDGNNVPITNAFSMAPGGVWDGSIPYIRPDGSPGPICAGQSGYIPFKFEAYPGTALFFSYASMILPSNDAFVANGNPTLFPVVDEYGNFIETTVLSTGDMALDGGTEVNDEVRENTAFFGQTVPNTGVDENGVVDEHPGFLPPSAYGILADPRFANADFTVEGYQFMEIKVALGEYKPPVDDCEVEFVLFDAHTDLPVGLLEPYMCYSDVEYNIQARPTPACDTTLSAKMDLEGPVEEYRLENQGPYMIFGDNGRGDVNGRKLRVGSYEISADIYSERGARGDLVVSGYMEFEVLELANDSCSRRLRGSA